MTIILQEMPFYDTVSFMKVNHQIVQVVPLIGN